MNARRFKVTVLLAAIVFLAQFASAQQNSGNDNVEVLHLKGPVYMIAAGGSNITASIGPDGVLLVDTGPEKLNVCRGERRRILKEDEAWIGRISEIRRV